MVQLLRVRRFLAAACSLCVACASATAAVAAESLSVDDCVRLALARSPAARAATRGVDAAAARVRAAHAAYSPRLLAESQYGRSEGFDEAITNGGVTEALLTVQATLLDGGLRDAQFAAARARLRSATAKQQQGQADVALAVRTAYFTALSAHAEVGIQADAIRTLRNYTELLQRQERLGLVPHNDVLRAQLAADAAQAAERTATAQLDAVREELEIVIDTTINAATLVEPDVMPVVEDGEGRIEASPVMVDARAAVEAARRDADAVRSEWRSHVDVTASGGALGVEPGHTFSHDGGGQFLFGFTLPLFDSGGTAARIAAAVADADGAEAAAAQSRQTVVIALVHAGIEARRAQADLAAWQAAAPVAAESFNLMRARYVGGGNVRLLEVLDALAQHIDTRLNVSRSLLAYRLAVATQYQILGEALP
jgi:cobalt-zinc-cadmium efflux system outer membrane protein